MWFIVVSFLSFNSDGSQNLFVFTDPSFKNFEQCQDSIRQTEIHGVQFQTRKAVR